MNMILSLPRHPPAPQRRSMLTGLLLVLASSMATVVVSTKNSLQSSNTISRNARLLKGRQHTVWRFLPGEEDDDEVDDKDKNDKPVRQHICVAIMFLLFEFIA